MGVSGFPDHFSGVAKRYARHRPRYPRSLFAYLAGQSEGHDLVWDCGTGNGQAAIPLAEHFARVHATDPSPQQLEAAGKHPRVHYRVATASASGLPDASVDLVTVAQALHWFDRPAFYAEVRRVLRPGGTLALWCYGSAVVEPAVDEVVGWFYHERVGRYWPPERAHIESAYRDIDFPYPRHRVPPFTMEISWTREELLAYIGTWSALQECRRLEAADPLPELADRLAAIWPDDEPRDVRWPLTLLIGGPPG